MFEKKHFEILPWQINYLKWWQKQALQNSLPQALLLSAPLGFGKLNLACKFAQLAFCKNLEQKLDCDYCDNCKLTLSGNYPDFLLLEPKGKNIIVDQVRNIFDFVMQSGARSSRKIIIVKNSETLNINSANAMLKILEEPPKNTSFIFLAEKPKLLPATILSRLRKIELALPDEKIVLDWLIKKGIEDAKSKLSQSQNSPLVALERGQMGYVKEIAILDALEAVLNSKNTPVEIAEKIPKDLELKFFIEKTQLFLSIFFRNIILDQPIENQFKSFFEKLKTRYESQKLINFYAELNANTARLATNPNRQLLIENILIKFSQSLQNPTR